MRRGPTSRATVSKRTLGVVFALYLCVVGFGVFGPSPGDQLEQAGEELRRVEDEVRSRAPGGGAPAGHHESDRWIFGDLDAEDVGNIAMFLPLGVLVPLLWPSLWWLTVPAAVALSGLIELVQLLFLPWRSPSVDDIGWNSLGAAIGFGLWLAGSWAGRRMRLRSSPGASGDAGDRHSGRWQSAPGSQAGEEKSMAVENDVHELKGIGPKHTEMLEKIGVDSIKELRNRNAASLTKMIEERHGTVVGLSEATVQGWIDQAKAWTG